MGQLLNSDCYSPTNSSTFCGDMNRPPAAASAAPYHAYHALFCHTYLHVDGNFSRLGCMIAAHVEFESKFCKPVFHHFIGSTRVETRRFQAMGQLDWTCNLYRPTGL
jgi:hypothetical protein